jgi:hypothetical protein
MYERLLHGTTRPSDWNGHAFVIELQERERRFLALESDDAGG